MKKFFTFQTLPLLLAMIFFTASDLQAQTPRATLSVQGILKKADGSAVEDGVYEMTFTLWKSPDGTNINTDRAGYEKIPGVETNGGVYNVVLFFDDANEHITPNFDAIYWLGVKLENGTELKPRPLLTHAPYAMALLGEENMFPSKGTVIAKTVSLTAIETPSGTPAVDVASNLKLAPEKSIQYDNLSDWRLVQVDDFDNGLNGWAGYAEVDNPTSVTNGVQVVLAVSNTEFTHNLLTRGTGLPNDNDYAFKKKYELIDTPNTPHTKIKVVFSIISSTLEGHDDIPEIYIGSTLSNVNDIQALVSGRNEVVLNTDANEFVIGFRIPTYTFYVGPIEITTTPPVSLDDIEIWVK